MRRLACWMAALVLGSVPALARADNLDNRLNEEMPAIVKTLKDKGYKNVGVLRFRVRPGLGEPGFSTPLSGNMVTRLESFLIIHAGKTEKDALGVLDNPSAVAAKEKIHSWSDDKSARAKLFELDYPLAWGKKNAKPDLFITGQIKTSRDLKKTTVKIQYFDSKDPNKLIDLKSFTMKSDRDILRDLGFSFRLSKKSRMVVKREMPSSDVDALIFEEMPKQVRKNSPKEKPKVAADKKEDIFEDEEEDEPKADDPKADDPKPGKKTKDEVVVGPDNVGGVEMKLLVGGKAQDIRRSGSGGDAVRWQVDCPAPGKKIAFQLKNKSKRRVGVVLRLNGASTVNQQTAEPERCRKWVLDKGEVINVEGFYEIAAKKTEEDEKQDGKQRVKKKVYPFQVLVGAAAKTVKEDLGDKAGLIEVDVFEEGGLEKQEMKVTGKGLPATEKEKAKESFIRLRNAHLKHARLKTAISPVTKREIIVAAPEATPPGPGGGIEVVAFDNPQIVAHVAIRVVPPEPDVSKDDE